MRRYLMTMVLILIFLIGKGQDSLDIKIGQMIMVGLKDYYDVSERNDFLNSVKLQKVGGLILYEKNLMPINTGAELAKMRLEILEQSEIPLFIGIDEEGGRVNRLKKKYGFPATKSAQELGELDDLDSTYFYARQTAELLSIFGINVNYAPVVDVNINTENPVIGKLGRSYSTDYQQVVRHASVFLKAHNEQNVATTLKHFPGHGSSADDTHLGIADVTSSWQIEELFPYKILLDSGVVTGIMTAHIVNSTLDDSQLPATLSPKVIQGVLREFLGFDGVVFSDDMHMGAISEHYGFEEAVVRAINAGVDVLLFSNNVFDYQLTSADELHQLIKEKVQAGEISEERIDDSYDRIMRLKKSMGLLDSDYRKTLKKHLKKLY